MAFRLVSGALWLVVAFAIAPSKAFELLSYKLPESECREFVNKVRIQAMGITKANCEPTTISRNVCKEFMTNLVSLMKYRGEASYHATAFAGELKRDIVCREGNPLRLRPKEFNDHLAQLRDASEFLRTRACVKTPSKLGGIQYEQCSPRRKAILVAGNHDYDSQQEKEKAFRDQSDEVENQIKEAKQAIDDDSSLNENKRRFQKDRIERKLRKQLEKEQEHDETYEEMTHALIRTYHVLRNDLKYDPGDIVVMLGQRYKNEVRTFGNAEFDTVLVKLDRHHEAAEVKVRYNCQEGYFGGTFNLANTRSPQTICVDYAGAAVRASTILQVAKGDAVTCPSFTRSGIFSSVADRLMRDGKRKAEFNCAENVEVWSGTGTQETPCKCNGRTLDAATDYDLLLYVHGHGVDLNDLNKDEEPEDSVEYRIAMNLQSVFSRMFSPEPPTGQVSLARSSNEPYYFSTGDVSNLLAHRPMRNLIMVVSACHSGAFLKTFPHDENALLITSTWDADAATYSVTGGIGHPQGLKINEFGESFVPIMQQMCTEASDPVGYGLPEEKYMAELNPMQVSQYANNYLAQLTDRYGHKVYESKALTEKGRAEDHRIFGVTGGQAALQLPLACHICPDNGPVWQSICTDDRANIANGQRGGYRLTVRSPFRRGYNADRYREESVVAGLLMPPMEAVHNGRFLEEFDGPLDQLEKDIAGILSKME